MKVIRTYLQFSVFAMLGLFITPVLVKATHFLYVHHDHHSTANSNQLSYSEFHSVCQICAYKALDEIKNKVLSILEQPKIVFCLYIIQDVVAASVQHTYRFNPRAPPVDIFFK